MNTRKDNNGRALKAWKSLRVGHIAKPLRYLKSNDRFGFGEEGKYLARMGDGDSVQKLALFIYNEG